VGEQGVAGEYTSAAFEPQSLRIVLWELDQSMQIGFMMEAMQQALERARPQICNSDQGSQFTSPQYTQLLLAHEVRISMDSKGRALDNLFTEQLWRTIKYEEVNVRTVQPKPVVSDGRMADKDENLDN